MNKKLAFILAISTAGAWPLAFFTSDAKDVLEAAGRLSTPPGAHVVILDDQATIRADQSGRFFRKERFLFRVVDQTGVNTFSQLGHEWLSWRQDKVQIRVRVIAPGGRAQTLDPSTFIEAGIPAQAQGVFTDAKTLTVPLPTLAPGAVIESEFELNDREFVNPAGRLDRWTHSIEFPILHLSVTIEAPARSSLRVASPGFSTIDRTESRIGDLQRVVLEASNLPVPESLVLAPPDVIVSPEIVFSTVPSWQQVAQWYAEIVDRQIHEGSSQADPTGDPLTRLTEIEAILAGIQKAVRYAGVELELAAYVPRTPQETLARAYGDCKDKSALLISRLRKAGIAAKLALLTPGAADTDAGIPGFEAFTHAIVYVPGAHPLWIDPASEVTPAHRLPWADQGHLALIVDPRTTHLVRTPEARPGEDRTTETFTLHMIERGKPALTDSREDAGGSEDYLRELASEISQMSKDQKISYYDQFANSLGVKKISNIDVTQPARLVAKGEGYRSAGSTDQSAYALLRQDFVPPIQMLEMIAEAVRQQSSAVAKKRTVDYYLADVFTMEERWSVVPPPGFKLKQLPEVEDVPIGPLTLHRRASIEPDGSALIVYRVETSRRRFTVTEATQMTEAMARLDARPPLRLEFMHVK